MNQELFILITNVLTAFVFYEIGKSLGFKRFVTAMRTTYVILAQEFYSDVPVEKGVDKIAKIVAIKAFNKMLDERNL